MRKHSSLLMKSIKSFLRFFMRSGLKLTDFPNSMRTYLLSVTTNQNFTMNFLYMIQGISCSKILSREKQERFLQPFKANFILKLLISTTLKSMKRRKFLKKIKWKLKSKNKIRMLILMSFFTEKCTIPLFLTTKKT